MDRLRQLAKALKEDLTDEQLQDMISFAAGGKGYVDRCLSLLPSLVRYKQMLT